MTDKLIELYYLLIPGGALVIIETFIFWQKIKENSFIAFLAKNESLLLVVFFIVASGVGLLIEAYSKLYFSDQARDKKEVHQVNRYLFIKNFRALPEYFSSRAAFSRHMLVVMIVVIVSLVARDHGVSNSWIVLLLILMGLNYASYQYYQSSELNTLKGYQDRDNLPGFTEYMERK